MATLPYQTNTYKPITIVKPNQQTGTTGAATGTQPQQTLQTATGLANKAATQPQTTLNMTNQKTQQLLTNPSGSFNPVQYKTLNMDEYNRGKAGELEALRQQTAPVANTGKNLQNLIGTALNIAEGRVDLSRKMDQEVADRQNKDLIAALAEGRNTATTESNLNAQAIANLVNTAAAQTTADKAYGYTDANGNPIPGEYQGQVELKKLENTLAANNLKLGAFIDSLKAMPGEQAFEVIKGFAEQNGLQIPVLAEAVQKKIAMQDIATKVQTNQKLTQDEYKTLLSDPDYMATIPDRTSLDFGGQWTTNGKNRWVFRPETLSWLENNIGGLIKQNGQVYRVVSYHNPTSGEKGGRPTVTLENIGTGQPLTIND